MTNSIPVQATHTKTHQAAVSLKTQAGSPKPDISKSEVFVNSGLVLRSKSVNEVDLLIGHEFNDFIIKRDDVVMNVITADVEGWTHEKLEAIDCYVFSPHCWDAFLGDKWVGSSEL